MLANRQQMPDGILHVKSTVLQPYAVGTVDEQPERASSLWPTEGCTY